MAVNYTELDKCVIYGNKYLHLSNNDIKIKFDKAIIDINGEPYTKFIPISGDTAFIINEDNQGNLRIAKEIRVEDDMTSYTQLSLLGSALRAVKVNRKNLEKLKANCFGMTIPRDVVLRRQMVNRIYFIDTNVNMSFIIDADNIDCIISDFWSDRHKITYKGCSEDAREIVVMINLEKC
jgi:hypothetical protein